MAEAKIGGLAVEVSADTRGFVDGMNDAIKALNKKKRAVEDSLIGVGKLAASIGAAAAAVGYFTVRATNMAEQLAKLSEKTGISVEQLSALKYAAYLSDVSIDELARGMNILSKNMLEAQAGTGEAKDAFLALGIAVTESSGALKTTDKMLLDLADKFSAMENGPGKAALAMRIFGRSGAELIPFLNQGAAGIEKLRKEAERLGIILDTQTAKEAEEFNDNLKRLQATGDALSIALTKNLVKALDAAAKEMLRARQEGEGFLAMYQRFMAVLFGGDDQHRFNVELFQTVDALGRMQRRAAEVKDFLKAGDGSDSQIKAWQKELEALERNIAASEKKLKDMQAAKDILLGTSINTPQEGEPGFVGPQRPKAAAPELPNQKAIDEAAKREQEIRDILHKVREEDDKRELEQIRLKNEERARIEEEAIKARLEQIDWEQDEAIRKGEEYLKAEEDQMRRRREMQQNFQTFMGNLAGLMNTNNKKLFEVGKKFAMADAAVKGAKAVMDAWAAGMQIHPIVAAAFAAAAAINSLNLINNIRSQQFGGGGGAPIAPTQGASGISDQGLGGGQTSAPQQTTIIRMQGDTFDQKSVRNLVSSLNESMKNGGKILIA